ncbi:MAG: hypothetical protein KJ607_06505, partial [Bacteroidetes bacterium]|nr:hypothetical protein [Bacteroidota bacterium]
MKVKNYLVFFLLFLLGCNNFEREYFKSGMLKAEYEIKNENRNGVGKRFYENGELYCVNHWKDGVLDGNAIYYYQNGQVKEEYKYINGTAS